MLILQRCHCKDQNGKTFMCLLFWIFQDTQEFLRCLMDQLHEELKEPIPTENQEQDEEEREVESDRGITDEDSMTCDSGVESGDRDMGEGSLAEIELLIREEAGRSISEKEKLKERSLSYCHRRTSSEQADEDADVDTAMIPGKACLKYGLLSIYKYVLLDLKG